MFLPPVVPLSWPVARPPLPSVPARAPGQVPGPASSTRCGRGGRQGRGLEGEDEIEDVVLSPPADLLTHVRGGGIGPMPLPSQRVKPKDEGAIRPGVLVLLPYPLLI